MLAAAYFGAEPARNLLFADVVTRLEARKTILASGDAATLDADTALADHTAGAERLITLFEGATLFDVAQNARPFEVSAGALTIEVLGATFEAARFDDMVVVSVSEGQVRVMTGNTRWTLEDGERLLWSAQGGGDVVDIDPAAVARWRQDRCVSDGLTFAQVADVIDRRLPGNVVVPNKALATSRVSGTSNLDNPTLALEALAATQCARVFSAQPLGYLILP